MRLSEKKFSMREFQALAACGVQADKDLGFDMDFVGTLEESLDYVKAKKTMDYWVALWTIMQFFSPKEARRVGYALLDSAKDKAAEIPPMVGFGMSVLDSYLLGHSDEPSLYTAEKSLKAQYLIQKDKLPPQAKALAKSVLLTLTSEPNRSCPLVALNLRDLVGHEFMDETVRKVLREHP